MNLLLRCATVIERLHLLGRKTETQSVQPVSVVCVSDTHNLKPVLPSGDILIHAGDLSGKGSFEQLQDQLDWLDQQPHKHKIVIAGNHDLLLDPEFVDKFPQRIIERPGTCRVDLKSGGLIYLCNEATELTLQSGRKLKVYASPLTPQFGSWAFQYPPIRDVWKNAVPDDTDILITHGPPALYMDFARGRHAGCPHLLRELHRTRPTLHVFGHIHPGRGVEPTQFDAVRIEHDYIQLGNGSYRNLLKMMVEL
ncbi:putative calcineurin-like phosphoesterase 2 [Elsinoe fawcettii]|nr:putative calcineurin-like phosphoesterase 2 [Elsinoe fawcettii]